MPALVAAAVAAFFLIGGVAKIGAGSAPYHRSVNGSFAAQGAVLADQSNRSAVALRGLLGALAVPGLERAQLQHRLDSLVSETATQATVADRAMQPAPEAGAGEALASALAARAQATAQLQSAVYGLLGLQPSDVIGAPGSSSPGGGTTVASPPLVPPSQVAADMARVGSLLTASDRYYAAARLRLRQVRARPILPPSAWVPATGSWGPARVGALVAQLDGSPTLRAVHELALVGFRLQPAVLPAVGGSTASIVPPTSSLRVTTIVSNLGNVAEPGVVVSATVQEVGSGTTRSTRRTLDLPAGGSDVEILAPLAVRAGSSYVLTVSVVPAAGGTSASPLVRTTTITVAPPTPPTTTLPPTSTTRPPTTTLPPITTLPPTTTTTRKG